MNQGCTINELAGVQEQVHRAQAHIHKAQAQVLREQVQVCFHIDHVPPMLDFM